MQRPGSSDRVGERSLCHPDMSSARCDILGSGLGCVNNIISGQQKVIDAGRSRGGGGEQPLACVGAGAGSEEGIREGREGTLSPELRVWSVEYSIQHPIHRPDTRGSEQLHRSNG